MKLTQRYAAVLFIFSAIAIPLALGQAANTRDVQAMAQMSSGNVVGAKSTNPATGMCTVTTSGVNARWTLNLVNVQNLGQVHLHRDPSLADGPTNPALVALTNIAQPNPPTVNMQGGFTALNFNPSGALAGQGLGALNSLINAKLVYCDVHPNLVSPFGASQIQGTLTSGASG